MNKEQWNKYVIELATQEYNGDISMVVELLK